MINRPWIWKRKRIAIWESWEGEEDRENYKIILSSPKKKKWGKTLKIITVVLIIKPKHCFTTFSLKSNFTENRLADTKSHN